MIWPLPTPCMSPQCNPSSPRTHHTSHSLCSLSLELAFQFSHSGSFPPFLSQLKSLPGRAFPATLSKAGPLFVLCLSTLFISYLAPVTVGNWFNYLFIFCFFTRLYALGGQKMCLSGLVSGLHMEGCQ